MDKWKHYKRKGKQGKLLENISKNTKNIISYTKNYEKILKITKNTKTYEKY